VSQHKDRIREAFTTQADSYASSVIIAAEEARRGFVKFIGPQPSDRVLDIATGPGFLALLFAEQVAGVIGVDLTPAMLERAEANRLKRGLTNVQFQEGDAELLSFPNATFDIVICGNAFHHFTEPNHILAEMVRMTKQNGKVAITDTITSENPDQASLHNKLERWRDPSHIRNLPLTELVSLFEKAGLQDIRTATYDTQRELKEWFNISHTPFDVAERVRTAFIASISNDATGLSVHYNGEYVSFTHTVAWIFGRR